MDNRNQAAKFAFYYLLSLVALVFTALGSGMVIFQIINRYIKDALDLYQSAYQPELMKFAISAVFIAAPIYFFTARAIYHNLAKGSLEKDAAVRRWLTYFILLVSSVVVIGWLIGTVNSFLGGELTIKFLLKSLTAIGISAAVFLFYLFDIRRESTTGAQHRMIAYAGYGAIAFVALTFAAGVMNVESPTQTRNRNADEQVVNSFEMIGGAVDSYYNANKKLPADLSVIRQENNYLRPEQFQDPLTGAAFEYKIVGEREYQLCADFRTANNDPNDPMYPRYSYSRWPHTAGQQCLNQKVQVYPDGAGVKGIEPAPVM